MPKQTLSASDAARTLGISLDTLRRWDRDGRIKTERDAANRRRVSKTEVDRLLGHESSTSSRRVTASTGSSER